MTRIVTVKNANIKNAMKSLEKLTDDDYKRLETLLTSGKDFSKPVQFGENSNAILVKIPDSKGPRKLDTKDGSEAWSVPVILPDGTWTNFVTTDAEETKEYESHAGCMAIVVGLLTDRTTDKGTFKNIKPYRGSLILADPDIVPESGGKKGKKKKADAATGVEDDLPLPPGEEIDSA